MQYLTNLFDDTRPGYLTEIAGPTNAAYVPFTAAVEVIYRQLLDIFDRHGLEYFVFAGSLLGYVRDGQVPAWMDDIDVIVMDSEIPLFVESVLPDVIAAGFFTYTPREYPKGGYHIMSLREAEKRNASAFFSDGCAVSVPCAQIDVFFSRADEDGYLRNLDNWGLYHRKDVPMDWVRPARYIEMFGRPVPVFAKYENDIRHEYGDVMSNVVVYSHGKTFARLEAVKWTDVAAEFHTYIDTLRERYLPGFDALVDTLHDPNGVHHTPKGSDSFVKIVSDIIKVCASDVTLTHPKHFFWILDLRRHLPKLKIHARLNGPEQRSRVAHFHHFYDSVDVPDAALRAQYDAQVALLTPTQKPHNIQKRTP